MDKEIYHATLKLMNQAGVNKEYCHGWATAALGNPALEEQRVTDAYTAGFEHGEQGIVDQYQEWTS